MPIRQVTISHNRGLHGDRNYTNYGMRHWANCRRRTTYAAVTTVAQFITVFIGTSCSMSDGLRWSRPITQLMTRDVCFQLSNVATRLDRPSPRANCVLFVARDLSWFDRVIQQYFVLCIQCPTVNVESVRRRNDGEVELVERGAHVYCSICGTSFNSDKQADQHYRGKLHAKKLRLARYLTRTGFSSSSDIKWCSPTLYFCLLTE